MITDRQKVSNKSSREESPTLKPTRQSFVFVKHVDTNNKLQEALMSPQLVHEKVKAQNWRFRMRQPDEASNKFPQVHLAKLCADIVEAVHSGETTTTKPIFQQVLVPSPAPHTPMASGTITAYSSNSNPSSCDFVLHSMQPRLKAPCV